MSLTKTLLLTTGMIGLVVPGVLSAETLRFATFNASLNRQNEGDLRADLEAGDNAQIQAVAEIIQRVNPDVLLINEFDYDPGTVDLLLSNYLNQPQNASGQGPTTPVDYAYTFTAPSNTGIQSGVDLNGDGSTGGPNDAFGFGFFPGQFGMTVLSRYEIDTDAVRTFQEFLWQDMPDARLPENPDGSSFYSEEALDVFRLSSKSHWDIPINVDGETVHFIVAHPTPPVFDGPEDANGTRNADEIRLIADYVNGADYIYDDDGVFGGLEDGARFVIAGDMNSDPFDGDSLMGAAQQLLDDPLINASMAPESLGAVEDAANEGQANEGQTGDPAQDTADFNPAAPGNLRVDYVLPSANLELLETGVFWPEQSDPLSSLTGNFPFPTSDHRLVYADVALAPIPVPAGLPLMVTALGGLLWLGRRQRRT